MSFSPFKVHVQLLNLPLFISFPYLHSLHPGFPVISSRRRHSAIIFPRSRHVLQSREYVLHAIAHSRACQLTVFPLEVLTSRDGGVATVWYLLTLPTVSDLHQPTDIDRLVATLGSRSHSKKINRKAILDVDVPKTCSIIIQPEAPMALRLQSNLLLDLRRWPL